MWEYVYGGLGLLTSVVTIITFVRSYIKENFDKLEKKMDDRMNKMDDRMDSFEKRMDLFDQKIISLEERMFWLATGKSLSQAILEEKMKEQKK